MFPFFQLGVSVWQAPIKRPVMCEWVKQIIYCAEQNNTVSPSFVLSLWLQQQWCFLAWFPVVVVTQCSVCRLSCQLPVPNGTVPLLLFNLLFLYKFVQRAMLRSCSVCFLSAFVS